MTPGETIQHEREQHGWTQSRLAEQCGLSTSAINRYERDKRALTLEAVHALATTLAFGDKESYRRLSADLVQTTCEHFGTLRRKRSTLAEDSDTESHQQNTAANQEG